MTGCATAALRGDEWKRRSGAWSRAADSSCIGNAAREILVIVVLTGGEGEQRAIGVASGDVADKLESRPDRHSRTRLVRAAYSTTSIDRHGNQTK